MDAAANLRRAMIRLAVLVFLFAPALLADKTKLKPGINSFTPQQDIQLGRQSANEVERTMPMCNDPRVDAYLAKIGKRLVEHLNTAGIAYPWEFHCVNAKAINAFALPGGFVFVNRGAIEAADNEAQLAAVMAHELSHVALRHGTNQVTKARYAQMGTGVLSVAGGLLGGAAGAAASGVGQFAASSLLLRYSRGAETQADVMGTQVLYDSGYDPRAMAAFFENLNASEAAGKAPSEFFSDHPNPDHRIERVDEEIKKMGGAPVAAQKDSMEFQEIKREVVALPLPPKNKPGASPRSGGSSAPPHAGTLKVDPPSRNLTALKFAKASLAYPDNWRNFSKKNDLALVPVGGVVDTGNGQAAIACGMLASVAQIEGKPPVASVPPTAYHQKVIEALEQSNEGMQVEGEPKEIAVGGQRGLSTSLRNESPIGALETDWLVTVTRPDGLYYFIFVAPDSHYDQFKGAFESILASVQFKQ
jgi:Zn-dependent protease with chaperone function